MAQRSIAGPLIQIHTDETSLPFPASKTDGAVGGDTTGLFPYDPGAGPRRIALYIESNVDVSITGVRLLSWEDTRLSGQAEFRWAIYAIGSTGTAIWDSLDLKAGFPIKLILEYGGNPHKMLLAVDGLGGATINVFVQRVI